MTLAHPWLTLLASTFPLALYVYQDGFVASNDGARYTSGKPQPWPFHRRFCGWPKNVLVGLTAISLVVLGLTMGTPGKALLLLTLPGAWFAMTRGTCVDALAMMLAWLASLYWREGHLFVAVILACVAGFVHERAPVFAAAYAFSPVLFVGLVVPFAAAPLRGEAPSEERDPFVGLSLVEQVRVHKRHVDLLDPKVFALAFRGVLPLSLYYGPTSAGGLALTVATLTRIFSTDPCRILFWAAPPLVAALPDDLPWWAVGLHVLSFYRAF